MSALQEYNRRNDTGIQIVAERITLLHEDISELKDSMKESMREMAVAVNKLVQVETRQEAINQAYIQVCNSLEKETEKREKLEERVDAIELEQPMVRQVVKWFLYLIGAVALAAVTFVGKAVGFI